MATFAKPILISTLILALIPIVVWLTGWTWHPGGRFTEIKVLFWITETVSSPWGIVTHLLLCLWFWLSLSVSGRGALGLFAILTITVLAGQGLKTVMKDFYQQPRPYVIWLEDQHHIPVSEFYGLDSPQRAQLVKTQLADQHQLPAWLRYHWQTQTGYTFPSGHTFFAATWGLLAAGILWPRRRYVSVGIIMLWVGAVMISRLVMGMHWPEDVFTSLIISAFMALAACFAVKRWIVLRGPSPS